VTPKHLLSHAQAVAPRKHEGVQPATVLAFPAQVEHTAVPPLNKNDAGIHPQRFFAPIAQVAQTAVALTPKKHEGVQPTNVDELPAHVEHKAVEPVLR